MTHPGFPPEDRSEQQGEDPTSSEVGAFIAPVEVSDADEPANALPQEDEYWRPPARFGSIPVESSPLGWDRRRGFRKLYPQVMLPTQVVERVSFGDRVSEPNRLFWGDNLHVMRQLPSESVDLIYIDPPFFSGRQYNVIFGDQNELRSFSDIWEGGMPGYLVWLNARLYEMKRLLKREGSIYIHLDWHASHYVKQEMDKIFGHENFVNEIVWHYNTGGASKKRFSRKHDTILLYARDDRRRKFEAQREAFREDRTDHFTNVDEEGRKFRIREVGGKEYRYYLDEGRFAHDVWDIDALNAYAIERIGYPTQKPEPLLERLVLASSEPGDVVADFFVGGGSLPAVAQRLGRRWIACDQSRVAVALTTDRLATQVEQLKLGGDSPRVPDFLVEHWGIYEADRLSETPAEQFKDFVLRSFGAVPDETDAGIHGHKGAVPVWVGQPSQLSSASAADVVSFANAIRKTPRYQQESLREGIMLAWAFRPDAQASADKLRELEDTELDFVRLDLVGLDSPAFRQHVTGLSTDRADYTSFLTFVQPPQVEVGWQVASGRRVRFDVSETAILNVGAKIINVQWDFDYRNNFTSSKGYSFARTGKNEPTLQAEYTFDRGGRHQIACRIQDDVGGEGTWIGEVVLD